MKNKFLLFLLIPISMLAFTPDIIDGISAAIRSGNPKNISKYFIENIDLLI